MALARLPARIRERSPRSLRQLAAVGGTSHATLSAYVAGRVSPTLATLDRIARSAGFDILIALRPRVDTSDSLTRGEELRMVLELAEQFPAQHAPHLEFPIFGRRER